MLISTRGRYALRILVDMAEHSFDKYTKLKDIAQRQEISEKYLESIVKTLVKNNIVVGLRGKGGGYRLVKEPDKINIGEVLTAMEETLAPVACLEDGAAPCARAASCRTLKFWRGLDDVIKRYTHSFTIADLMQKSEACYDYII
ncbi:MAG: Rrf2 family transcriptional regulator [Clostridiales bacterium]|nr:Rrf2 family transcriptional regulator [Clostridiales bacterium]